MANRNNKPAVSGTDNYDQLIERAMRMSDEQKRARIIQIDTLRAKISLKIKALQLESCALGEEADYLTKELNGQLRLPHALYAVTK